MREILNETLKIFEDRGIGLEPLIHEFVYDFSSLSEEAAQKRVEAITAYYKEILDRSGSVKLAYNKTREWANRIYVQAKLKVSSDL